MEGSNLQHTGWTINNQRHSYRIKNVGRQWPLGAWMWRSIPARDKWYSYCWLLGYNCCLRWLLKYRRLLNIFNGQQCILHPNMTTIRSIYSTLAYNRVRDSSDQSRLRIGSDWNEHSSDLFLSLSLSLSPSLFLSLSVVSLCHSLSLSLFSPLSLPFSLSLSLFLPLSLSLTLSHNLTIHLYLSHPLSLPLFSLSLMLSC